MTNLPPNAHAVARLAGVSQSAVSRTFTPGASVSPATRRKVEQAAAELGYRPNLLARSLITGRTNLVGVVMGNLANPFYAAVLEQLVVALAIAGCRPVLLAAPRDREPDLDVRDILNYRVDALILASTMLSSRLAEECHRTGVAVLLLNRTTSATGVASVTGDNAGGAAAIADLFVSGGHRRPAFVAGSEDSSTSRSREVAFAAALARAGLPPPMRAIGYYERESARVATRALLSAASPPDAIFYANDHMACAGIEVARAEFGRVVGRDLSIAGFDGTDVAGWESFDLTTYAQPVEMMVGLAVTTLLEQYGGAGRAPQLVVPGRLIPRSSTRC